MQLKNKNQIQNISPDWHLMLPIKLNGKPVYDGDMLYYYDGLVVLSFDGYGFVLLFNDGTKLPFYDYDHNKINVDLDHLRQV